MAGTASKSAIRRELLSEHGRTFAKELGIRLERGTPAPLFQMLVGSVLFSKPISSDITVRTGRALWDAAATTPRKMLDMGWSARTKTLNRAGYARYDESTSRALGDLCDRLLTEYGGDLRELREAAGRDLKAERRLLKRFKGVGDTGVDIFFREVQAVWTEASPFADKLALRAASKLDLASDVEGIDRLVSRDDLPRLVAALVRVELQKEHDSILEAAA